MGILSRLFLCLVLIGLTAGHLAAAQVEAVRVVGDGNVTRVTIWTGVETRAETLLWDTGGRQQILVAIGDTLPASGPVQPVPPATGVSAYGWQSGFLAFTLDRPMMVARQLSLPPAGDDPRHRIVLDLAAVSDIRFASAAEQDVAAASRRQAQMQVAAAQSSASVPEGVPSVKPVVLEPRRANEQYVVVIDPGHGGRDPGAIATNGAYEKTVVLRAARQLAEILRRDPRFDVKLTRSDDRFIELEDRVNMARDWEADLFISLHADAAGSSDVAGASVYTISERGVARIERESDKNDWHMPIEEGVDEEVSGILESLWKRETRTNSGVFAELLIPQLATAGPVLRNTHRNAGFYVLLAPDVPAVLLEIGFLTNAEDARRLSSADGRQRSMGAVAQAIDQYFDRQDVIYAGN